MPIDQRKLRAWWATRQGLDGSLAGKAPAQILALCGWAWSVGGAGPYLTLFSRGGTGRAQADQAVADLAIHELPSARGCTYVLPAEDFALGLKLGQSDADMRVIAKLGVTEKEIDTLCAAVLDALAGGEVLDPEALRARVGDKARNLGEPTAISAGSGRRRPRSFSGSRAWASRRLKPCSTSSTSCRPKPGATA